MIKKLFKIAFGPAPHLSQSNEANKDAFILYFKGHTKRTLATAALMLIVAAINFALIFTIYFIQMWF
jgi:hypothetical protein